MTAILLCYLQQAGAHGLHIPHHRHVHHHENLTAAVHGQGKSSFWLEAKKAQWVSSRSKRGGWEASLVG